MKPSKLIIIYASILTIVLSYYAYCSYTGRAIFTFGDRTTWENNDNPTGGSTHTRTRLPNRFYHK